MDASTAEMTTEGTFVTEWDGGELIELCKQKRNRDIEVYWNSVLWHNRLAHFFAERAIEAWEEPASTRTWDEKVFGCEAYVIACVQSLNPMADMLSQIITMAVFEGSHDGKGVKANEISDKLKKKNAFSIKNSWDTFYKSNEFRYVNAFSNTIKHRRLIRTESLQFDITGTHGGSGNVFMPFKDGIDYPGLTVNTIVNQYRLRIRGYVLNTGVSINDYLKSL